MRSQKRLTREDLCLPQLLFPPPQDASVHKKPRMLLQPTSSGIHYLSYSPKRVRYSELYSSPSQLATRVISPLLLLLLLLFQQLDRSQCTTLNAALSGNDQQPERHLQRFEYHLSHLQPPSLVPITVQAISSSLDDRVGMHQETVQSAATSSAPTGGHQQERLLQLQLPLQLHLKLRPLPLPMPPPLQHSSSHPTNDNKYQPPAPQARPVPVERPERASGGLAVAWREAKRVLLLSSISAGLASRLQLLERRSTTDLTTPSLRAHTTRPDSSLADSGEASEAQLLRAARGPRLQRHSAPSQQQHQPSSDIKLSAWSTQGRSDMEPQPSNRLEQETGPAQLVVGQKTRPWRPSRSPADKLLVSPERRRPSYLLYQDSASRSLASEYLDSTRLASEYHMPRVKFQLSQRPSFEAGRVADEANRKLARLIESLAGTATLKPLHQHPQVSANYSNQSLLNSSHAKLALIHQHSTTSPPVSNLSQPSQANIHPALDSTTSSGSQTSELDEEEEEVVAGQVNSNKVMPELNSNSSQQPPNTSHLSSTDKHIKLFHFKRKPDMNKLPFYKRPLNYTELGWTRGQIEEHQRSLQLVVAGSRGSDSSNSPTELPVASNVAESDNSTELPLLKRKRRGKSAGSFDKLMAELHGQQQQQQPHQRPLDHSPAINKRDETLSRLIQVTFNGGGGQRRRLLSLVGEPIILRPIGFLDASSLGRARNLSASPIEPSKTRQQVAEKQQVAEQPQQFQALKKPSQGLAPSGEESFLLAPSAQPVQHLAPPEADKTKKSASGGLRVPKLLMKPMRPAKYSLNGYIPKPTLSTVLVMSSPSGAVESHQSKHQTWSQQVAKMLPNSYRAMMSQVGPLNAKDLESSTSNEVFSRRRGLQQQQQRSLGTHHNQLASSISPGGGNLAGLQLNESNTSTNQQQQLDRAFRLLQLEENKRKYVNQRLAEAKSPTLSAHKAKLIKAKLGLLSPGNQQPLRLPPSSAASSLQQTPPPQQLTQQKSTSAISTPTSTTSAPVIGLSSIPKTDFECTDSSGRFVAGLFADHKTGCQVWHLCSNNRKYSFLCPIGTAFNAKLRICDWRYNVRCEKSSPFSSSQAAT